MFEYAKTRIQIKYQLLELFDSQIEYLIFEFELIIRNLPKSRTVTEVNDGSYLPEHSDNFEHTNMQKGWAFRAKENRRTGQGKQNCFAKRGKCRKLMRNV